MKKLKLITSFDESDIQEEQIKYLMDEDEFKGRDDALEEVKKIVYNDYDLINEAWADFKDYLTELMGEINKGRNTYKIIGKNMGWRHLTGSKILKADDGEELLKGILPNTQEFSLYVYKTKTTLIIKCSHHDAPMGEYYYIKPLSIKELNDYEKETY